MTPVEPKRQWLETAFRHAPLIVRARLTSEVAASTTVEVLETVRGYQAATTTRLRYFDREAPRARPGSEWLLALHHGGNPADASVLSAIPAGDRQLIEPFVIEPWAHTPIVMAVRVANTPATSTLSMIDYEVVRTLRGSVSARQLSHHVRAEQLVDPPVAGDQLFLMSGWSTNFNKNYQRTLVWVHDLRPIDEPDLAALEEGIDEQPRARRTDGIAGVRRAWQIWRAPIVATTRVGVTADEATGCGGRHFTLELVELLRGEVNPATLPTAFRVHQAMGATGSAPPYLFRGGGHCRFGGGNAGDRFLAAGQSAGGRPEVQIDDTAANRRLVADLLAAGRPRFALLPVDDSAFSATRAPDHDITGAELFEPAIDLGADRGSYSRFEVARRHTVPMEGGGHYAWLEIVMPDGNARAKNKSWMLAGPDIPAWRPGERFAAVVIDADKDQPLIVPGTLVPDHPGMWALIDAAKVKP